MAWIPHVFEVTTVLEHISSTLFGNVHVIGCENNLLQTHHVEKVGEKKKMLWALVSFHAVVGHAVPHHPPPMWGITVSLTQGQMSENLCRRDLALTLWGFFNHVNLTFHPKLHSKLFQMLGKSSAMLSFYQATNHYSVDCYKNMRQRRRSLVSTYLLSYPQEWRLSVMVSTTMLY